MYCFATLNNFIIPGMQDFGLNLTPIFRIT